MLQTLPWRRLALAGLFVVFPAARAQEPGWEELGPSSVGGRVSALAADPRDPRHLVVGTPAGGLWRSTDGGQVWQTLAPWLAATPLSAVAISPVDSNVLLAGTGALSDGGSVSPGIGLIRSTDGGTSWTVAGPIGAGLYVSALLVDDADPSRVLVATDTGVKLSTDAGTTFAATLDGDAVSMLVRDPLRAGSVFASGRGGLYRSDDRGSTWVRTAGWPLRATDTFGVGTTSVAVSARTPGLLYATIQVLGDLNRTDRALLLRSRDGGTTFEELAPPPFCTSCGFAQAIALDPLDDARILLGGDGLSVSTDAGATWRAVTGDAAGVHRILVLADRVLVAGTSGVATLDAAWSTATSSSYGLAVTSITSLDASRESPPRLLAGTADSGTLLAVPADPVPVWHVIHGRREAAGPARFDPFDADRLYVSSTGGRLFRSDDRGVSFRPIVQGLDLDQPAPTEAPLEPSPLDPGTLFTGRMQLFRSTDSGDSWTGFRPPGSPEITRIAVSPVRSGRVYFAVALGAKLFKADGIGTDLITISDDPGLAVTSLHLDPDAENVLYATLADPSSQTGRVFKSYDFGQAWEEISPPGLATPSSIVKDAFGALYIGTSDGVWRSPNDGSSWSAFRNGLAGAGVSALRVADGTLFAGTHGRGVFRIPLEELVTIDTIPSGLEILVDGQVVTTPYYARWARGSVHRIEPVLFENEDTRQVFVSWSDGGASSHPVTTTTGREWYTAAIRRSHRLRTEVTPAAGGALVLDPPSADGFYVERSFATLVAVPSPEHRFAGYSGDASGSDGILGFAVMDRPRTVKAHFEPLQLVVRSEPQGLSLGVDGASITTPATFQWAAGSVHTVSAPELVDRGDGARPLAFDGWNDLGDREHSVLMRRDTFVTDLTARYIPTITSLAVPSSGYRFLKTTGQDDAPRLAALLLTPAAGVPAPEALLVLSGRVDGTVVTELATVSSEPRLLSHAFVEEGGSAGRTRITAYNPGTTDASVDLVLRGLDGTPIQTTTAAFRVPAGSFTVQFLSDLLAFPEQVRGLLTLVSNGPLATSIHSMRANLRPSSFLDPILVAPFNDADRGVPSNAAVQTFFLTPDTVHRLAVSNTGLARLSGNLAFRDDSGAPLRVELESGPATTAGYDLPPGATAVFRFRVPETRTSGAEVRTAQVRVLPRNDQAVRPLAPRPSFSQPAPMVQLVEERSVGSTSGQPVVLPRTVPPSRAVTRFLVPVELALRDSGVVLTNRLGLAVTATLTLRDSGGGTVGTVDVPVPPGGQVAVSCRSLFPSAGDLQGSLAGTVTGPGGATLDVAGFLRRVNERGEEILAGFPVLDGTAGTSDVAPVFPLALDGDSWRSEWFLWNATPADLVTRLVFQGDGRPAYFPFE
ncbi:MAG: hypothetical protein RBU36_07980 [Thermoanaerobaculia bacterium]|jgi:photosystem II stability/assembly factor-like uncharacterized protein|nr:hypothetical protein [Thermoanaerobaculia bacterium]